MTPAPTLHPVTHGLRVALAAACTVFVAVVLDLSFVSVAVYSTTMSMVKFPVTIFQRGLERVVGRVAGIGLGLVVATLLPDRPVVCLGVEAVLLAVLFYIYLSGRLAYTFLNAGLFLAVIIEIAHNEPQSATAAAGGMIAAIVVGVIVADLVSWLTLAEKTLAVVPGGEPLWPLRADWMSKTLMMVVTMILTQLMTRVLGLNQVTTIIAVIVVVLTTSDVLGMIEKGRLRIVGATLACLWVLFAFLVLVLVPRFIVLMLLLFIGVYLAVYLAQHSPVYSYAGVQMSLVVPMLLIVSPDQFGDITEALTRVAAAMTAIVLGVLAAGLWPWRPAPPAQPTPS